MFSFIYLLIMLILEVLMLVTGLVLLLFTFPFDKNRRIIHYHSYAWGLMHYWVNPWWKIRYAGGENIDKKKNYIIISNHQSMLDICLLYKIPKLFKWVSKKEAMKIPIVGWALWLHKDVLVSRGDSSSVKKMIRDCSNYLKRNVSIIMFPEGTRTKDGKIHPFKEGAFMLAKMTKTAILPVVIDGTYDVLPRKGFRIKRKQIFQVQVLQEISETEIAKKTVKELTHELYETMRNKHEAMAPQRYKEPANTASFGVIFDLDGVIVNNNAYHKEAFEMFLRKHGFENPGKVFKPNMYGTRNVEIMREIFGDIGKERLDVLAEEKEAIYRDLYRPHMREVAGLTPLLKSLKEHKIPIAIGSSAHLSNINFIIDGLHIREYFNVIIHENMVEHGKPNPEVYLKAASLLGLEPSHCIIFEDSIAGVQAGQRAGAKVIGVTTTIEPEKLKPYIVFSIADFSEVSMTSLHHSLQII